MSRFWRQFKARRPPYVHPADTEFIKADVPSIRSFKDYVTSGAFNPNPDGFQLSLYPSPYLGDLRKAKVIVLLLNPGFNTADYYSEMGNIAAIKRARRNTIAQRLSKLEFKFFLLDPAFCWTPGFRWWEQKVRKIALKICELRKTGDVSYREALRLISSVLAAIELVPYHSVSFRKGRRSLRRGHHVDDLPSVKESIRQLRRCAKDSNVTIYIARQHERWNAGLEGAKATVLESNSARGVSFTPNSPIGKAILKAVARLPTR